MAQSRLRRRARSPSSEVVRWYGRATATIETMLMRRANPKPRAKPATTIAATSE